eukprot:7063091-Prymnesium_polylepis.1
MLTNAMLRRTATSRRACSDDSPMSSTQPCHDHGCNLNQSAASASSPQLEFLAALRSGSTCDTSQWAPTSRPTDDNRLRGTRSLGLATFELRCDALCGSPRVASCTSKERLLATRRCMRVPYCASTGRARSHTTARGRL